jgi:hypothetical protein
MRVQSWSKLALDIQALKGIVEEQARAHKEL